MLLHHTCPTWSEVAACLPCKPLAARLWSLVSGTPARNKQKKKRRGDNHKRPCMLVMIACTSELMGGHTHVKVVVQLHHRGVDTST